MKQTITKLFKNFLTRVGACLSDGMLVQIQGVVNYLKTGRWMANHGFAFPNRVPDREAVWSSIAKQVRDRQVLYLEFGVAAGNSITWWSNQLKHPETQLHGFDSFEGMPEDAGAWSKGEFST